MYIVSLRAKSQPFQLWSCIKSLLPPLPLANLSPSQWPQRQIQYTGRHIHSSLQTNLLICVRKKGSKFEGDIRPGSSSSDCERPAGLRGLALRVAFGMAEAALMNV